MKERDYIVATNLTKVRIAEMVLRQMLPEKQFAQEYKQTLLSLDKMIAHYEAKVEE